MDGLKTLQEVPTLLTAIAAIAAAGPWIAVACVAVVLALRANLIMLAYGEMRCRLAKAKRISMGSAIPNRSTSIRRPPLKRVAANREANPVKVIEQKKSSDC